jgi:hypothetical protein
MGNPESSQRLLYRIGLVDMPGMTPEGRLDITHNGAWHSSGLGRRPVKFQCEVIYS